MKPKLKLPLGWKLLRCDKGRYSVKSPSGCHFKDVTPAGGNDGGTKAQAIEKAWFIYRMDERIKRNAARELARWKEVKP